MSGFFGVAQRRHPRADARFGTVAVISLVLALLAVGVAAADRPSAVVRVSASDAARTGSLIGMLPHAVGSASLVEVEAPPTATLLAVSPDGAQAALADQVGQLTAELTLARADGSQLRVPLPGLISAGFSADGSWLAVVDGRGVLWKVDTGSGDAATVADGPFLGSPIVAADGSLLLLSVSSVEAPFRSRLVQVATSNGLVTQLSTDELVYAGFPLADGSVAVAAHEPGGTVVRRVADGASALLADLGQGAVNVAVARDGREIAYELAGSVFLVDQAGGRPRSLGPGSRPCFADDVSALLVKRGAGTAAFALDGSVLAVTQRPASLAGSPGCLP